MCGDGANDLMAIGVLVEAKRLGLRVPDDLSVIGCDDIPMASSISPSLTTLRQPMDNMGKTAAEIIVRLLEGEQIPEHQHHLPLDLIKRESAGKV